MPVDLDLEHTWPVFLAEPTTTDATPVDIVLADLPEAGDYATVELVVLGADDAGTLGGTASATYAVLNMAGTPVVRTLSNDTDTFGAGGLTIATLVVGDELRLRLTGIAATTVQWMAVWRLCQRVFPP